MVPHLNLRSVITLLCDSHRTFHSTFSLNHTGVKWQLQFRWNWLRLSSLIKLIVVLLVWLWVIPGSLHWVRRHTPSS
ncbi:hypothetical protein scyTo_0025156 [Scyliorhinus torazame]|uniref:Uncharacterized protein n=1 Tax=Scyliorhinus torazame TaxID=75743 RepID=A0A401QGP6_SCYTO|nr:hypothetical protein [Scyliorhinus torazame]